MLKIILLFVLSFSLNAGLPIEGKRVFTQPDGTQFEGFLKGDSAFHWIESDGSIVTYNPKDKFYYKALVDSEKGLVLTKEKPNVLKNRRSLQIHKISDEDKKNLRSLSQKIKEGKHPY